MTTIYFDACCLNRPFDDQTQDRIHLEAEAVLLILRHLEQGDWKWISSEVVNYEIQRTPNTGRRSQVQLLTNYAHNAIMLNKSIICRADELKQLVLLQH